MVSTPEHEVARDRARLAERVLDHHLARVAVLALLNVGDDDLGELEAELREDRPALRRARPRGSASELGEEDPGLALADSGESEPCTRFVCTSRP